MNKVILGASLLLSSTLIGMEETIWCTPNTKPTVVGMINGTFSNFTFKNCKMKVDFTNAKFSGCKF